jgi:hypothetical protein
MSTIDAKVGSRVALVVLHRVTFGQMAGTQMGRVLTRATPSGRFETR